MRFDTQKFLLDEEPWEFEISYGEVLANTRPSAVGDTQTIQQLTAGGDEAKLLKFVEGLGETEADCQKIGSLPTEVKLLALAGYTTYAQGRLAKKSQAATAWVRQQLMRPSVSQS